MTGHGLKERERASKDGKQEQQGRQGEGGEGRQLMCSKHFYNVVELSAIKNTRGMWQLRRMQLPLQQRAEPTRLSLCWPGTNKQLSAKR